MNTNAVPETADLFYTTPLEATDSSGVRAGSSSQSSAGRGNFPGVNFNPAGVAPVTATRLGIDLKNANSLVTSYSVPWDALLQVVNKLPVVPNTDSALVAALTRIGTGVNQSASYG